MSYILDTDIIDKLVDGDILLDDLPTDRPLVAVHAQMRRLASAGNEAHRMRLLSKFERFTGHIGTTGTVMKDGAPWEQLQLCNGARFRKLKEGLQERGDGQSNARDVLLADMAISNKLILITTNSYLAEVVCSLGGEAVHFSR